MGFCRESKKSRINERRKTIQKVLPNDNQKRGNVAKLCKAQKDIMYNTDSP